MAKVSGYVTAPYQGVSQAPPQVRLLEQAEDIQDCMLSIAEGVTKRPPLTFLGELLTGNGGTDGPFFPITRPPEEGDVIAALSATSGGDVFPKVWRLSDLAVLPVDRTDTAANQYLNANQADPETTLNSLRTLTVEDFTFIVNRKNPVAKSTDTAPARPFEALIWCRVAAYARLFTAKVANKDGTDSVLIEFLTPDGTTNASNRWVDTDRVMDVIANGASVGSPPDGGIISSGSGLAVDLPALGYTVELRGSVLYISRESADFNVFVTDGQGGSALVAVKDRVQNFSDLPKVARRDFTVRITQGTASDEDDFFVQYNPSAGGTTGTWEECIAPGAELGYDPATLPVALINDPDLPGWRVKTNDWLQRTTGDQTLAPDPDFVGSVVEDLTYWKGRVAFISREGITLSGSDDPFRLYPKTLAVALDDDPVGFLSPFPDVSLLRYGIPFDDRLIGFGDKCQVRLETQQGTPVSANTTSNDLLQTYEFSSKLRPQGANGRVYFAAPKGDTASAIYELAVDNAITNKTDAEDLTLAVPQLVPASIDRVANCPVNSFLAYGVSGATKVYPHIIRYAQGQRVQNAFNTWNLPPGFTLGGMFFRNTTLYVNLCKGIHSYLCTMDLAPNTRDDGTGATLLTHLDMRVKSEDPSVVLTYSETFDQTLVTMPYDVSQATPKAAVRAPGGTGGLGHVAGGLMQIPEGYAPEVIESRSTDPVDDNQFVLNGKWDVCPMWLGLQYSARVRPTRIYVLGRDSRPIRSGRLQLAAMSVDLANTGYFRVEITPKGRATRVYAFEGYRLSDPESQFDIPPDATTVFRVPIRCQNEQTDILLINDSHFGSKFLGFEWEGDFNPKAKRLT
jgi:hypothetical protein